MTLVVQASHDLQSVIGTLLKPPTPPAKTDCADILRSPLRPRVTAQRRRKSEATLADAGLAIMTTLPYAAGYTMSYLARAAAGTPWRPLAEAASHDAGLLAACHCLLFALAQPAVAPLIARHGVRRLQLLSLLLSAAGALLLAATPGAVSVLAGRALMTLSCAGAFTAFAHSALAHVPPRRRAIADCLLVAAGGLCASASGLSLGAIGAGLDRQSFYAMLAGATLAFAGLVWIAVPHGGSGSR